jgi:hypothetical protein
LEISPPQRCPQHDLTTADDIERGELFGQFHRVMQRQQANDT